jgi:hypothetical protein
LARPTPVHKRRRFVGLVKDAKSNQIGMETAANWGMLDDISRRAIYKSDFLLVSPRVENDVSAHPCVDRAGLPARGETRRAARVRARHQRIEPFAIGAAGPARRDWFQKSQRESCSQYESRNHLMTSAFFGFSTTRCIYWISSLHRALESCSSFQATRP